MYIKLILSTDNDFKVIVRSNVIYVCGRGVQKVAVFFVTLPDFSFSSQIISLIFIFYANFLFSIISDIFAKKIMKMGPRTIMG